MDQNQTSNFNNGIENKRRQSTKKSTRLSKSKSKTSDDDTNVTMENDMDSLGFEPDKIVGVTTINDNIVFRIKVKNSSEWFEVISPLAHKMCPELVISFYEQHLLLDGRHLYEA